MLVIGSEGDTILCKLEYVESLSLGQDPAIVLSGEPNLFRQLDWRAGRDSKVAKGGWTPTSRILITTLKMQCLYWPNRGGCGRGVQQGEVFRKQTSKMNGFRGT